MLKVYEYTLGLAHYDIFHDLVFGWAPCFVADTVLYYCRISTSGVDLICHHLGMVSGTHLPLTSVLFQERYWFTVSGYEV